MRIADEMFEWILRLESPNPLTEKESDKLAEKLREWSAEVLKLPNQSTVDVARSQGYASGFGAAASKVQQALGGRILTNYPQI